MKRPFATRILLPILTAFAYLPMGVLYVFSDITYIIIYYIARYRRHIVRRNIDACFVDRDIEWRRKIERDFYRNFTDQLFETIKLLHIPDEEISRRVTFDGLEQLDEITASGRDVVLYFAHCGNWEWAPSMTLHMHPSVPVNFCQVYRPLRSQATDWLMLKVRSRFGSYSFPKASVMRDLIRLRRDGVRSVTGFMSDQKPSHNDPTVVTTFLGRPTAFISGTETLARRMNMATAYWDMEKTSRGHYHLTCRVIETPSDAEFGTTTRIYANLLEKTILRNPAIWLWSHNRWKNPVKINQQ